MAVSERHADAIRHASIDLGTSIRKTLERLIEGDELVVKTVQKYLNRNI